MKTGKGCESVASMKRRAEGERVSAMLRRRGKGKHCPQHPRRASTLGVLWADGRAVWFPCNRQCFAAWKRKVDAGWPRAEVVRVVDLLRVR